MFYSAIAAVILLIILARKLIDRRNRHLKKAPSRRYKAVVALGLGGHIREMYEIVNSLDASKYDFCFISDKDDHFTMETYREKFLHLVRPNMETRGPSVGDVMAQEEDRFYKVAVPKSGRTSVLTTFLTAVQAFVQSLVILYRIRPDVVITNGPGIAVPLCYAAVFLKICLLRDIKVTYVESCCRVENLSYSGSLVYYISDMFIVLWPQLLVKYPGALCIGKVDKL